MRYRFQWTAPIAISPHDPKVVYHAGNVLFRTSDGGQSWTAISPDLTRNDKEKQNGGRLEEHYSTIFTLAEDWGDLTAATALEDRGDFTAASTSEDWGLVA